MKQPHDLCISFREAIEHHLHLLTVFNPALVVRSGSGLIERRLVSCHVTERFGFSTPDDLPHDNPPGDHCQVRGQRTLTAKSTQGGKIVAEKFQKHIRTQVVDIVRREPDAARMSGMIDHVDEQTHEAIDKVLPRPGLLVQAAFKQTAINFGESHETPAIAMRLPRRAPADANCSVMDHLRQDVSVGCIR